MPAAGSKGSGPAGRRARWVLAAGLVTGGLAGGLPVGPAWLAPAAAETGAAAAPGGAGTVPGLRYETEITPVDDSALAAALTGSSNLRQLADAEQRPSPAGLVRRAEEDVVRLTRALRAYGYYAGTVDATIDGRPLDDDALIVDLDTGVGGAATVPVVLAVETGPRYTVAAVALAPAAEGDAPLPVVLDDAALGLAPGDPALAAAILDAEAAIVRQLRQAGYPFAAVPERQAVVDHATQEMTVTYRIAPGSPAAFGPVAIEGLEQVDEPFLRGRVPIGPGDPYRPAPLRQMRDDFVALGVFSSVRVDEAEALTPDGRLPVTVSVVERPRRFIGFGADFATSEGFGARAFWGHRNLFGQAERLRIEGEVGRIAENDLADIDFGLNVSLEKPDFLSREQTLSARVEVGRENPEAFRRRAVEGEVGIERPVGDDLRLSVGVRGELSDLEDADGSDEDGETVVLVSLPVGLSYDTTDDLLDPTRGVRARATLEPFTGDATFLRTRLTAATYVDLLGDGDLVLAARGSLGSIVGVDRDDVPENRRFFAGGGGSVRGFSFQGIGPRDGDGDPLGGASVIEAGVEARLRITDTIGIVPFIEGGAVYDSAFPDFSEDFEVGAGLGVRYYTGFGPLRVDFGVPVIRGEEDEDFQFYVSIGQAF